MGRRSSTASGRCRQLDALEVLEQRGAVVPGRVLRPVHDVVAVLGGDRDDGEVGAAELFGQLGVGLDLFERGLGEVDQVDLVDRRNEVFDAEEFRDPGVTAGLSQHTGSRIDEQNRDVGVGGAGEHVPRVTLVAGRIGEDIAAAPRWKRTGTPHRW